MIRPTSRDVSIFLLGVLTGLAICALVLVLVFG